MAAKPPMPQFVARCLEEIGLEGRCGVPVMEMFDKVDQDKDVAYRRYAWKVLSGMKQLHFHVMTPLGEQAEDNKGKQADTKTLVAVKNAGTPRRKRKWATTLLNSENSENSQREESGDGRCHKKHKNQPLQPVIPSMRRIAAKRQRRRMSDAEDSRGDSTDDASNRVRRRRRQGSREDVDGTIVIEDEDTLRNDTAVENSSARSKEQIPTQQNRTEVSIKEEPADTADETRWVLRSPRGFRLGEEVDVVGLTYDEAVTSNGEGVLGVVACEELRLKYLGVMDPNAIETISPQFDLLEIIGRSRERGENAAALTSSQLFGDSRKLHYLLDMLIAANFVDKKIVTADQRRFNIVHLRRFSERFHPSMISPSATLERDFFPKELLAKVIVGLMKTRGQRTCVFADIGRELGYNKRQQEQLRKYFMQQMHIKSDFPIQLFMARCKTGSEFVGRKLWCIRLNDNTSRSSGRRRGVSVGSDDLDSDAVGMSGPVVERGIMEQMFTAIQDRKHAGATVPELRDMLGVPTFKLPYRLAQALITSYNISVEQVVVGKSTMYRMFVPDLAKEHDSGNNAADRNASSSSGIRVTRSSDKYNVPKSVSGDQDDLGPTVPSTMIEAARGSVRASTIDNRRNYILKRVQMEKIVSLHQLRSGVIELEQVTGPRISASMGSGAMDIRSLRRIVDELVEEKKVTLMDVTLPPKQVLLNSRRVKCVVLIGYQRSREAIRSFIETYVEEQQKKHSTSLVDHDNNNYVVVSNRSKSRHKQRKDVVNKETQNPEVVKFNGASYKSARAHLIKLMKQSRRLGQFHGVLYKCRAFHLMICQFLSKRSATKSSESHGVVDGGTLTANASNDDDEVEFALKDVLDALTVKEYIQVVGVPEMLTENEESIVKAAVAKSLSWDGIPDDLAQKIRGCEADRFSKILRVLLELKLLQVVNDASSSGLFNMLQSSDDFDSMVSRVAFATLSGGLFKMKRRVRIAIKQGTSVLHQLPSEYSYAYAPSFSCKNRSGLFSGRIPLEFELNDVDDAKAYWKSLRFLSVEGAQLGTASRESNGISVNLDGAVVKSAPLSDLNIYTLKTWVPHSTTASTKSSVRAKAAAGPIQLLKRKQYHLGSSILELSSQKKRKVTRTTTGSILGLVSSSDASDTSVNKFRKLTKRTCRGLKWTLEEDLRLIDLYLEQVSCGWFIEVPLALQFKEERVAFRTTALSRTLMSWKELGKALNKKPMECMLRVRDLLQAPAIQAKIERAKVAITELKNPSSVFHEELAIIRQPRLSALLCRALQIIMHERSSYYSVLADMLMNSWNESEVKLVWRYLWLAGIITRPRHPNPAKDQKQRGFQLHSQVHEMKSLKIPHYLMETFCEAAKYLSFIGENVDEVALAAEENERYFEHEIEPNLPSGQAAAALSSAVSGYSNLVPTYVAPSEARESTTVSVMVKRAMAVKGLAGHLSRKWGGVMPDAFLKEYWTVKSVSGILDGATQTSNIKSMEAFSFSEPIAEGLQTNRKRGSNRSSLSSRMTAALETAAQDGLTLSELREKCASVQASHSGKGKTTSPVLRELDKLVSAGKVVEVNAYDHIRFVLRQFAEQWTLHPYRIASDSTTDRLHFVFDKSSTIVARPWLHLDGSTNTKMVLKLKRKVVNIVMCCPGIQDEAVHKKMRKVLSLQDMRSLLEELMKDGIIYARVFRDPRPSAESIFGMTTFSPSREAEIVTMSPGELRCVDFSRDRLHYFPSVNCMELLGAEACDADLG